MDNNLRVVVVGPVGRGKSHLLHTIEKALKDEYGELIDIVSNDLVNERNLVGHDIAEWQRPTCEKITLFEMTEGSFDTKRFRFEGGLHKDHPLHDVSKALFKLVEKHITNITVSRGATPSFIATTLMKRSVYEHLYDQLRSSSPTLPWSEFVLEDVGYTGTLFATKIEGIVKRAYNLSSDMIQPPPGGTHDHDYKDHDVDFDMIVNIGFEYTPK